MPCSAAGCPRPPLWRPCLDLRSRKGDPPTRLTFLKLAYCEEDKAKSTIETFLSDEGHAKIAKHLRERGKEAPDQRLTTLSWIRVAEDDGSALSSERDVTTTDDTLPF